MGESVDPPIIHYAPYKSILNIKVKRERQAYVLWVLGLIKLNTVQGKTKKKKKNMLETVKDLRLGGFTFQQHNDWNGNKIWFHKVLTKRL